MLKRLAILYLFAGVEVAFGWQTPTVGVNPYGDQKQVRTGNTEKANADQRGTQDCPLIVDVKKPVKTAKDAEEEKAEKDRKSFIDRWTLYLAFAVATTAALQVIGIGFQIAIFRKQTSLMTGALAAAQNSADAARLNAQAVINAERPWLLVAIKPVMGPMGGFNVHVRNRGRTPAMITTAHWGCAAVKEVTDLPREPSYWPRELVKDRIVMPDGAAKIWWFDPNTLHNVLKEGFPRFSWEGRVFVFGTVLYRDLADPSPTSTHETRWIGLYQPVVGDLDYSIFRIEGIGVADEYHRYT